MEYKNLNTHTTTQHTLVSLDDTDRTSDASLSSASRMARRPGRLAMW